MLGVLLQKLYLFLSAFCSEVHELVNESELLYRQIIKLSSLICFVSCTCLSSALLFGYGFLEYNQNQLSVCEINISDFVNFYVNPRRKPRYVSAYNAALPRSDVTPASSYMTNLKYGTSSRDNSLPKQNPFYFTPNQSDQSSDCKPCCIPGPPGPPGLNGRNGHPGDCGSAGEPGIPAPIGFMPCVEDRIAKEMCSKCPSGPPGLPGDPGPPGDPGIPGEPGFSGKPGTDGDSGQPGSPGPPGHDGEPGKPGDPGESAIRPSELTMEVGNPGPPGPPGPMGEMGPPGVASDMFMPEPGLKGVKGTAGDPGRDGVAGQTGQPGLPGVPGEPGICPTYCAVDGGVFHDLSIVSNGNYIHERHRRGHNYRR